MLPVSSDLVCAELEVAGVVLKKWHDRFREGLPMIDRPGTEEELGRMMFELCGELKVVAGKCETLAEVMSEAQQYQEYQP